jgi:hypothetical protein
MTITTSDGLTIDLEEYEVRRWFMAVDIAQAVDTLNVVRGIIETRQAMQPRRARRKDAGTKRGKQEADQASEDRRLFESTQG